MTVSCMMLVSLFSVAAFAQEGSTAVVKVNGRPITKGDVDFACLQQAIGPEQREQSLPKVIDRLIDRQLIRAFLEEQKVKPPEEELQFQIAKAEARIRKAGEDPAVVFNKLGYTPDRLKAELGLSLAWQVYVRKTVTPSQMKEYFDQHHQEFDGTQLRGRQIFLKLPQPADETAIEDKRQRLSKIRRDLVARKLSFAEAAKMYSEAPTRDRGGDVGLFNWRGKLPASVSQAAFKLQIDEISEPIVSPFGVHLIQVTERLDGDFSLEDVRPVILEELSRQLWGDKVAAERSRARIERVSTP